MFADQNKRKLVRRNISLLFGLILLCTNVHAQLSTSASVTATATVLQALSIAASGGTFSDGVLDFGNQSLNTTTTINPKTSADAILLTIAGAANANIKIDYIKVDPTDGTISVPFTPDVRGHTVNNSAPSTALASGSIRAINGTGNYYIFVGGSITIPAGAPTAIYLGSFTLTVTYQ
ncbi:MAG: hypothetical protein V1799_13635 [bacterium]